MTSLKQIKLQDWGRSRRSQRLALTIQVIVYRAEQGHSFCEGTSASAISAHGALISLMTKVSQGHQLTLKNALSGREEACRIVFTSQRLAGPFEVGVEFLKPAPEFWNVAFPPVDWSRAT